MSPFQELFVLEYLRDFNGTQAYIRAGGSKKTAGANAHELLTFPEIRTKIEEAKADRLKTCQMAVADVLKMWCEIATADPNEIVAHTRTCCRHCHGRDFKHQWRDEAEWGEAINEAIKKHERLVQTWRKAQDGPQPEYEMPSAEGGFGFDPRVLPNPECVKCYGDGIAGVKIADTRRLSGPARRLYAGVKTTKDGTTIVMRDQDAAAAMVARHLGMLNDKLELGGRVGVVPVDEREALKKLSTEELQQLLALRAKMGE
jgi:phage terminase small subunit